MSETEAEAPKLPASFWHERTERSLAGRLMASLLPRIAIPPLLLLGAAIGVDVGAILPPIVPAAAVYGGAGVLAVFVSLAAVAAGLRALVGDRLRALVSLGADHIGPAGPVTLSKRKGDEIALASSALDELGQLLKQARAELLNQRRLLQRGVERETELLARRNLELGRAKREAEQAVIALKQAQTQMVQQERMATLGQLLAGIAHEINNPVNYMVNSIRPLHKNVKRIEALVAGMQSSDREREEVDRLIKDIEAAINLIQAGAGRTASIVQNLRTFSRSAGEEFAPFDLREGLDLTLELLKPLMKDRIEIIRDFVDVRAVSCSQGEINQVFTNILSNAAQAIEGEGAIRVTVREEDLGVAVGIEDSGCGINQADIPKIFDPFFTTKEVGKGTGLGLSISYNIVQEHGGTIDVESKVGVGTKFRVWLPYEPSGASKTTTQASVEPV